MSSAHSLRRPVASLLTAGALAVSSLLVLAPSASAEYGVVADRGGSTDAGGRQSFGEISKVEVNFQRKRLVVRVRSAPRTFEADTYNVWVDTTRRGSEPQRLVQYVAPYGPEPYAQAYTLDNWTVYPGPRQQVCGQVPRKVTQKNGGPVVEMRIPLRCLPDGSRGARVSVGSFQEYGNDDWAPARRAWSRWFSRG